METLNEYLNLHKKLNTAIVYKTYLGATRHYAHWLADRLNADIFTTNQWEYQGNTKDYDRFIVMSGVYGGYMPMTTFLKKHWDELGSKVVHALAVGPAKEEDGMVAYANIPPYIRANVIYQQLPGRGTPQHVVEENLDPVLQTVAED